MNIQNFTLRDYVRIAVRSKWIILVTILLSLGIAWGISVTLPKSYRSSTLILVESPKIPESYVNPVVRGSVADRLSMIQQQVLSRTVLSQVIEGFNLFSEQGKREGYDGLIEGLRKNIKIETKGAGQGGHVEAFSISFSHSDPTIAMKVTEKLASQFIESNLKVREQLVAGTTEFLELELKNAKLSLETQEQLIAQFKRKHMGELPSQTDANLQTLNRLQKDLASVSEQLQGRADRRASIQKMINAYEALGLTFLESPQSSNRVPGNPAQEEVLVRGTGKMSESMVEDPLAARLRELERSLATMKSEYKDSYPDIIQLKQEIASVKARLAEKSDGGDKKADMTERKSDESVKEASPARTVKPPKASGTVIDPYLHELRKEREEIGIGIHELEDQQRRLKAQIREYEQRVERAPEREQELLVLQRDYENTKKNYQALLEKQLGARISENLEKRQKGESFLVLDPAYLPAKPESPNQMRIMLIGLLVGCALGYGAAFGLEMMAGVIRRPEEAESLLGLPVLASIPDFRLAYTKDGTKRLGTRSVGQIPPGTAGSKRRALPRGSGRENGYLPQQEVSSEAVRFEVNLVSKWRPNSIVAEQFRVAATRLVLSGAGQSSTIVAVTSAIKGEGKTTTSANLAYVLAKDLGKSTLVIDCDFKQPRLHSYIGTVSQPGLVEAIYGDAPLEECLHKPEDIPLWVLPCGRMDHHLVDLTKIPQINGILSDFRGRFQFIILDAPPILPLADMNLLASIADMLVLVVRAGVTPQAEVSHAMKVLKPAGKAGIIMTGSDSGQVPAYLQGYYRAGHKEYVK